MRKIVKMKRGFAAGLFLVFLFGLALEAQAQRSSVFKDTYAKRDVVGDGYMVAGDLWETIKPMNSAEANGIEDPLRGQGALHWLTIGPDGAAWDDPTGLWPGGYDLVQKWRDGTRLTFPVYEKDGWGSPLRPSGDTGDDRFMFAYYQPTVVGANDPNRNYKRTERFTDASRSHMVYEAGWPTTAGIDYKIRAHQYTTNDQNLNDFIVIEMSLTNTGIVDANADGTPDMTNHAIDAIGIAAWTEPTIAVRITQTGGRSNRFGAGRTWAYLGVPETLGSNATPMAVWYANVPESRYVGRSNPAAGERFFGVNDGNRKEGYTDVWMGQFFMGAKQGAIDDNNLGAISANSPDKQTIFGTHPVGSGNQKGWYTSMTNQNSSLHSFNDSERAFYSATATWYDDYGKESTFDTKDLSPNPAFFSGGTAGDITSFVPKASPSRPNGDSKYRSEDVSKEVGIAAPVFEDALNPLAASGNFYDGTIGFTLTHTFGESINHGAGPWSLAVGESMTVTFVVAGGFRWEGLNGAAKAAEWAWGQGWDISGNLPVPPAPELKVVSTTQGTAKIQWTDVNSIDSDIDGYKVWRASQYKRSQWLEGGFRLVDNYQAVHNVGDTPPLDDVNPHFDAEAEFVGDTQGWYQPEGWGPYELVAKIPKSELSNYAEANGNYDFAYEDTEAITGFTYWYYVSSYKDGNFTGPRGAVSGHIESSNFTRNGRNAPTATEGEIKLADASPWGGTYPWATRNAGYPTAGTLQYKNMGGAFTVTPPFVADSEVASSITVTPNPYKITGLNDVRTNPSSHNIDFLGLPENYTITILDVAGQIMLQQEITNAVDGRFSWDMFSKDGIEVASGVYVYHISYGSGQEVTGHFAILR